MQILLRIETVKNETNDRVCVDEQSVGLLDKTFDGGWFWPIGEIVEVCDDPELLIKVSPDICTKQRDFDRVLLERRDAILCNNRGTCD